MELRVLGPLEARSNGRSLPLGGRRQRLVLATLLLHANEVVSADRLIDAVWGEAPPRTARKSLQVYVSRLRAVLEGVPIERAGPGYVLRIEPDRLDSRRFTDLARAGREDLGSDPARAATTLGEALALWHGTPWGDLADEAILRPDVERLGELYLSTLEDKLEADLERGNASGLVGELEGLVSTHPLRERLCGLLMVALYREGRQSEALRAYQETRALLAEELGIDPSPDLQRLEEQILLQDPELKPRSVEAPTGARKDISNPYKGLRPFSESDAEDFHGRDSLIEVMIRRLAAGRFVAVIGPSGSGKSSAVRAGLVPALRRGEIPGSERWAIAGMLPGTHPFEALEAALLRAADDPPSSLVEQMRGDDLDLLRAALRVLPGEEDQLVLVIDQFEELFLLVEREEEKARFARNLIEGVEDPHSPLRVVVTLRADFFDRPLDYPGLAELVTDGQVNVFPIDAPGLEEAVVRPAARVGVHVEPELIAEIVSDIASEPGALPLFEFVLTELFDRRSTDTLTLAGYRQLRGLRGALSRRAELIHERLDEAESETARQVFLRLVTLGEGTEDTRRRVLRSELEALESAAALADVLEQFGEARLLTFDRDAVSGGPTVEVAHEALLREWPRYREWVEDARGDLRLQRNLASEASQWLAASRDPDYLLTGSRLVLFEEWRETADVHLTTSEVEFLEASAERRDAEIAAEMERSERERWVEHRSVNRLRALVGVLIGATIAGGVLTAWALNSRSDARDQAAIAEQRADDLVVAAQIVRMKELTAASVSARDIDPELGALLALQAVDLALTTERPVLAETGAAVHWAFQALHLQYPESDQAGLVLRGPNGLQGVPDIELAGVVAALRSRVSRSLTEEECHLYFEDGLCPTLRAEFPAEIHSEPLAAVSIEAGMPLAGTRVTILGSFSGSEAEAFVSEMQDFTQETGIEVDYEGSTDFEARLVDLAVKGRPPDLSLIPQPAFVAGAGREGALMDLGLILDVDELRKAHSPHVVALATVGDDGSWPASQGSTYGALVRANIKSLIWYPVSAFESAGYEIPTTWEGLLALVGQIEADGGTPWCHGEGAGSASGWPGTDWIEDLVLHEYGPDVYDGWTSHEIPFDDPRIRSAWTTMNDVLLEEGQVLPAREKAAVLNWYLAVDPMVDEPPGCWLYHQASFLPGWLPEGKAPGRDVNAFPFPSITPEFSRAVVGGGEYLAMLADRPEVRAVTRYMVSPRFGQEMAKMNPGYISPHRDFPMSAYQICDADEPETEKCVANDTTRSQAETIRAALNADDLRFDASDLMDPCVGQRAFWEAMIDFVAHGPDNLDDLLADIEGMWAALEATQNAIGETPGCPGVSR